ncbi:hypothetical protein BC332_28595 [Capsicum chinense]|nr:hypothetical protein BC332_28595 [Capsicum chinense]
MKVQSRSDCSLRILGALLLVTGYGALGVFFVVIVWTIFESRSLVALGDNLAVLERKKEFDEYKKFIVVVYKAMEDGKASDWESKY